jgi:hypothetical protein
MSGFRYGRHFSNNAALANLGAMRGKTTSVRRAATTVIPIDQRLIKLPAFARLAKLRATNNAMQGKAGSV